MSAKIVELASAKWLSPEQAEALGTNVEASESPTLGDESEAADADVPSFEVIQEQNESFLKTLVLALFVGVLAFAVVFLFPTGSSNAVSEAAVQPDTTAAVAIAESGDLDESFGDAGESQELSDAEVVGMAAEIMELNLRRKQRGK